MGTNQRIRTLTQALAALATAGAVHGQTLHLLHVDAAAPTGGDGLSWATALRDLQDGLDAARAALAASATGDQDKAEVLVGPGVYRPDRGTGDRSRSFVIGDNIAVIGGFAGRDASAPYERDFQTGSWRTVLSGDLLSDDQPGFINRGDNSRAVVRFESTRTTSGLVYWLPGRYAWFSALEATAVRGGNADAPTGQDGASGGGVRGSTPWYGGISQCLIEDNQAADRGGGVFGEFVTVRGCRVQNNRASAGGGLAGDDLRVSTSWLLGNTAGAGGAVWAKSLLGISNKYTRNVAQTSGGAASVGQIDETSSIIAGNQAFAGAGVAVEPALQTLTTIRSILRSSLIMHNVATGRGGGVFGSTDLRWCTLVGNRAPQGPAMHTLAYALDNSPARVVGCILWNNSAASLVPAVSGEGAIAVERSIIQRGPDAFDVPSIELTYSPSNSQSDPNFENSVGVSNDPTAFEDKDYGLRAESPCVDASDDDEYWSASVDAAGNARGVNARSLAWTRLDLGALERQSIDVAAPRPPLHVRADAAPGGDGGSWTTALRDIQQALLTPGVSQVWIARGVYTVDPDGGNRNTTLWIGRTGIELHGGFAGTESALNQRNMLAHPTVISGDLAGNDSASPLSRLDNSFSLLSVGGWVPRTRARSASLIASGLEFRGAAGTGAVRVQDALVVDLTDCRFVNNSAYNVWYSQNLLAGALSASGDEIVLRRCSFLNNTSDLGAGAAALDSSYFGWGGSARLADCKFIGNTGGRSGAISVGLSSTLDMAGCDLVGNVGISDRNASGGLWLQSRFARVSTSRFVGNAAVSLNVGRGSSELQGGGVYLQPNFLDQAPIVVFSNCLLARNLVIADIASGGAIGGAVPKLINCTIADNAAGVGFARLGGEQIAGPFSSGSRIVNTIITSSAYPASRPFTPTTLPSGVDLSRSIIRGLQGPLPTSLLDADPLFINPNGPDTIPGTLDDDYRLRPDSPAIDAADVTALDPGDRLVDVLGSPRLYDDPAAPNTGAGSPAFLDIGAFEYVCPADFDRDGRRTIDDIFTFINAWFATDPRADVDSRPGISVDDVFIFLSGWFRGC